MANCIHVAVALIVGADGRILVARRPDHADQGGLWEFPGGKVEADETVVDALRRELTEELGIVVEQAEPLIRLRHRYPAREVLLDVWRVLRYAGEPYGREGQPVRWLLAAECRPDEFPAANRAIITAAQLPSYYLITPEPGADTDLFLFQLERALQRGVRLIQLRATNSTARALLPLAIRVLALCRRHKARLLINRHAELAHDIGADGVHLSSAQLLSTLQRPYDRSFLIAASCHDEVQIDHANQLGIDFAVIAPVLPTASHPDRSGLGWQRFAELADRATVPVFALGGMTPEWLKQAQGHGAQGIAAIRGLWEAS